MKSTYFTDVGLVRNLNEDFIRTDEEREIYIIADGMGGHKSGEIASEVGVKEIYSNLVAKHRKKDVKGYISDSIKKANKEIYKLASSDEKYMGMGTTISAVVIRDDILYFGHIGDSRIYLISDDEISLVTKDHTMVEELVDAGTITREEAKYHPKKNVLIRALGTDKVVECDTGEVKTKQGDMIILVTDGVYEYIDELALLDYFKNHDIENASKKIKDAVIQKGAKDNLSLIAVRING